MQDYLEMIVAGFTDSQRVTSQLPSEVFLETASKLGLVPHIPIEYT